MFWPRCLDHLRIVTFFSGQMSGCESTSRGARNLCDDMLYRDTPHEMGPISQRGPKSGRRRTVGIFFETVNPLDRDSQSLAVRDDSNVVRQDTSTTARGLTADVPAAITITAGLNAGAFENELRPETPNEQQLLEFGYPGR